MPTEVPNPVRPEERDLSNPKSLLSAVRNYVHGATTLLIIDRWEDALVDAEAELENTLAAISKLRDSIPCCSGDLGKSCLCCELQAILDGLG